VKLTFLGTRGEIEARTVRHGMHSALLVEYYGRRVMIDCGDDWRGGLSGIDPDAIVLTHAHPDHAWGLRDGAPCPVHATRATWEDIGGYPIEVRRVIEPRRPAEIEGIGFEAFEVEHSTRCPAVGYRVTAGRVAVFYGPDLVYIHEREAALSGCRLYIGDGATLERSFVRRQGEHLIGHTPVRTQLTWCAKLGVPEAIVTHCGAQIVEGDPDTVAARIEEWARERGVAASIARDGMTRVLR
jgi:phosphoribosyl 1,2-cyclic phosphodiesterase